ncbi:sulfotransferase [Pelagibacteraceae bacterium]|nr:sulfotransferase [Pelagibacteraceae bacterium]
MSSTKQLNQDLYDTYVKEGIKKANKLAYREAENDFLEAIALDKKNQTAYINLSNIYLIQRKINNSVKILMQYIKKNDFHESIINHTSKILHNYKYNKELLHLFDLTNLDSKKNYIKKTYLYFIQGLHFKREEKYINSKESFSRSISCNKYFFESYTQLFDLYEQTNEFDKFNKLLKVSFKNFKDKKHTDILLLYKSLILNRRKKFNESQEIITNNNLYFAIKNNKYFYTKLLDLETKNNESLKNYQIAFQKINERNNILSSLPENKKFDSKNIYNSISKYKIFFNKKNLDKIYSRISYHNDNNLVFLVGFPRSGTTLLDSILRSHSKISVLEEKPYLLNLRHEFFKQNNNDLSSLLNITQNVKDKIRNSYFKKINSNKTNKKRIIIDKFPLTIIELGFVKCIFPNAKIILALRHPCDVIISCYFSSFKINDAMVNFLNWNNTINFYDEVFNLFEIYKNELNLEYLIVKYEDVICDLKSKAKEISRYLDIKYEDSMEKFYITARNRSKISTPSYSQVINPIYKSSVDRWKNYPNAEDMKNRLSKWIKKFNY